MKSLKNMAGDSLEQMIDYKVVDKDGDHIGSLHSLWSDPFTGTVEFLGVKTGWLFGHNHVVPADKAELDEAENVVRIPYAAGFIKEAPSMSAEAEISESEEEGIFRYYGLSRAAAAATELPSEGGTDYEGDGHAARFASAESLAATAAGLDAATVAEDMVPQEAKFDKRPADPAAARLRRIARAPEAETVADESLAQRMAREEAEVIGLGGWAGPLGADFGGATVPVLPVMQSEMATSEALHAADSTPEAASPREGSLNADPISGEPGAHPVGTGLGAAAAGTAGAAIGGAVGGPVGAAVGGIAGAVGGGLAGKSVAEAVDPTVEDAYWHSAYQRAAYYDPVYQFEDYQPAYRVGYAGYGRYGSEGGDFAAHESMLQEDYSREKGSSRLDWSKAKSAVADAWNRLKARAA